jgi:hypothetical protein
MSNSKSIRFTDSSPKTHRPTSSLVASLKPIDHIIETLREENTRPYEIGLTPPRNSNNYTPRITKSKIFKRYGEHEPVTDSEKRLFTGFLESEFVRELIEDKNHRMLEEKKMSCFEEIRKVIVDNRAVRMRYQNEIEDYGKEMADQMKRKNKYEEVKEEGEVQYPENYSRNTKFEFFQPDVPFELKTKTASVIKKETDVKKKKTEYLNLLGNAALLAGLRSMQNEARHFENLENL